MFWAVAGVFFACPATCELTQRVGWFEAGVIGLGAGLAVLLVVGIVAEFRTDN